MKRENFIKGVLLFFVFALIQGFNVGHAGTKKIEWRVQSIYPTTSYALSWLRKSVEMVDKKTGGEFQIKIFLPGQLVKTREVFTATSKGMIDGAFCNIVYFAGTVPVANAKYGPFLAMNDKELAYLQLETDFLKPVRKELAVHNIFFVGAQPSQPGNITCRKVVRRLADMKGLKMRGAGVYGEISKAWGAVPVSIAPAEMYTALQRGTMDGTYYPLYACVDYKYYEVVKCVVWPAPLETSADFFVNLDSYNALPAEWQKILVESFMEVAVKRAAEVGDAYTRKQEKFLMEHGVEVIHWPAADVAKAKELCMPIREKFRAASPASAEVIAIAVKALEEYRKKH